MLSEGRGSLNIVVHKQILDAHLALETTNLDENLSFGKNWEIINVIKIDSPSPRHRQQPHLRSFFLPILHGHARRPKKAAFY